MRVNNYLAERFEVRLHCRIRSLRGRVFRRVSSSRACLAWAHQLADLWFGWPLLCWMLVLWWTWTSEAPLRRIFPWIPMDWNEIWSFSKGLQVISPLELTIRIWIVLHRMPTMYICRHWDRSWGSSHNDSVLEEKHRVSGMDWDYRKSYLHRTACHPIPLDSYTPTADDNHHFCIRGMDDTGHSSRRTNPPCTCQSFSSEKSPEKSSPSPTTHRHSPGFRQ